jgi:purine-nucleoside phosphorylase
MSVLTARLGHRRPRTAIILGSSLGPVADAIADPLVIPYGEIPGFPASRVSGHAGKLVAGTLSGTEVVVLQGRSHPYESGNAAAMRPAIEILHAAGIGTLVLTNAAGSLDVAMRAGSIMLITDHINLSGMNPLVGQQGDENFVAMTDAYDPALRRRMIAASEAARVRLHQGVYVWFSGPSFETPAEIRMAQILGGNAVGMSTVPETILARRFGMRVVGLSVITNLGAGLEGAAPSHEETKTEGAKAAADVKALLAAFFEAG